MSTSPLGCQRTGRSDSLPFLPSHGVCNGDQVELASRQLEASTPRSVLCVWRPPSAAAVISFTAAGICDRANLVDEIGKAATSSPAMAVFLANRTTSGHPHTGKSPGFSFDRAATRDSGIPATGGRRSERIEPTSSNANSPAWNDATPQPRPCAASVPARVPFRVLLADAPLNPEHLSANSRSTMTVEYRPQAPIRRVDAPNQPTTTPEELVAASHLNMAA